MSVHHIEIHPTSAECNILYNEFRKIKSERGEDYTYAAFMYEISMNIAKKHNLMDFVIEEAKKLTEGRQFFDVLGREIK